LQWILKWKLQGYHGCRCTHLPTVCCWWKLQGDEPNSLIQLLDVTAKDMRLILRKCRILYGAADSFRTSKFENLIQKIGCHYTTYKPSGKPEHFLKLGEKVDAYAVERPKDLYSFGGVLERMPVANVHLPGMRTKISRRLTSCLIDALTDKDYTMPCATASMHKR